MMVNFSNIILWRHAEAEIADYELGEDDMARVLTAKGQRQAKRMARWLKLYLPKETVLLSSPAERAMQTGEALNHKLDISKALRPSANLKEILDFLTSLEASIKDAPNKSLLIVGHQPWLGQLVTHLTGFSGAELTIKKGAIWWLRQSLNEATLTSAKINLARYNVISVQAPSLLPK
jgi:phosphohistidine phosphatase